MLRTSSLRCHSLSYHLLSRCLSHVPWCRVPWCRVPGVRVPSVLTWLDSDSMGCRVPSLGCFPCVPIPLDPGSVLGYFPYSPPSAGFFVLQRFLDSSSSSSLGIRGPCRQSLLSQP